MPQESNIKIEGGKKEINKDTHSNVPVEFKPVFNAFFTEKIED